MNEPPAGLAQDEFSAAPDELPQSAPTGGRPRDRRVRVTMFVLALLGLGVASYLTYTHYAGINPVCSISHGCETVQHSSYSKLAGIPVAVLGLAGYVAILAALLAPASENTRLTLLSVVTIGFGFSLYLTYREVFTIKAICQWCVSSAVIMALLTGLAVTLYLRGDDPLQSALSQPGAATAGRRRGRSPARAR